MGHITDITSFLAEVAALPRDTDPDAFLAFRGQSKDWKCVPKIGRSPPYTAKAIYAKPDQTPKPAEYRLFMRFRDTTVPHQPAWLQVPSPVEHAWRQLVLAQHYGLHTRLLDWTTKPLVGLYFAVEEEKYQTEDGVVQVLGANLKRAFTVSALARHNLNPPLYEYDAEPGLLWPPDLDSRVTAQGSVFTIGRDPRAVVAAKANLIVPANRKKDILRELRQLGITRGHLFPDIQGIRRSIMEESATWDSCVL